MKDIVDHLKRLLLSDWNDVNFVIGTNPSDLIEIKFDVESADSAHGLNAYMNTLMNTNVLIGTYNLRKVTQYWPYQEGSSFYYMIAPPWKKLYVVSILNIVNAFFGSERYGEHEQDREDSGWRVSR